LKWLTLSLLAYAAVLFTVHVPWGRVMLRTVWPHFTADAAAAAVVVGVFGTTISPYLFFWQASEEVEEMRAGLGRPPLLQDAAAASTELRRIRWDTWSGMFYSDLTAYCIILATAVTLHAAGLTDIETAAQAASALRPVAGEFAYTLFALGILGVGLIGVPVLAGSGAYALAETMGWNTRLLRRHRSQRAPRSRDSIPAHQADEGLVLERRDQWRGGGPAHGSDHLVGVEGVNHGTLRREPADRDPRLDRDLGHGRGRGAHVPAGLTNGQYSKTVPGSNRHKDFCLRCRRRMNTGLSQRRPA
jgi:hypothetical protein